LSVAIAWISSITSGPSRLAGLFGRDFGRQTILNRFLCQRSNASGLTTCNDSRHRRISRAGAQQEQTVIVVERRTVPVATQHEDC
jgi:hypothetical protein